MLPQSLPRVNFAQDFIDIWSIGKIPWAFAATCVPKHALPIDEKCPWRVRGVGVYPHLEGDAEDTGETKPTDGEYFDFAVGSILPAFSPLNLVRNSKQHLGITNFKLIQAVTQPLQLFAAYRSSITVEKVERNRPFAFVIGQ